VTAGDCLYRHVRAVAHSYCGSLACSTNSDRTTLVSSELIALESARTIDRLRLQGSLSVGEASARLRTVNDWRGAIDLVLVRTRVLSRASEPMPMPLGTLDAVHLATALLWRDGVGPLPTLATHDTALGHAAQAFGFEVRGI